MQYLYRGILSKILWYFILLPSFSIYEVLLRKFQNIKIYILQNIFLPYRPALVVCITPLYDGMWFEQSDMVRCKERTQTSHFCGKCWMSRAAAQLEVLLTQVGEELTYCKGKKKTKLALQLFSFSALLRGSLSELVSEKIMQWIRMKSPDTPVVKATG